VADAPDPGELVADAPDPGELVADAPDPGELVADAPDPGELVADAPEAGELVIEGDESAVALCDGVAVPVELVEAVGELVAVGSAVREGDAPPESVGVGELVMVGSLVGVGVPDGVLVGVIAALGLLVGEGLVVDVLVGLELALAVADAGAVALEDAVTVDEGVAVGAVVDDEVAVGVGVGVPTTRRSHAPTAVPANAFPELSRTASAVTPRRIVVPGGAASAPTGSSTVHRLPITTTAPVLLVLTEATGLHVLAGTLCETVNAPTPATTSSSKRTETRVTTDGSTTALCDGENRIASGGAWSNSVERMATRAGAAHALPVASPNGGGPVATIAKVVLAPTRPTGPSERRTRRGSPAALMRTTLESVTEADSHVEATGSPARPPACQPARAAAPDVSASRSTNRTPPGRA
jgi:hypothetical protein